MDALLSLFHSFTEESRQPNIQVQICTRFNSKDCLSVLLPVVLQEGSENQAPIPGRTPTGNIQGLSYRSSCLPRLDSHTHHCTRLTSRRRPPVPACARLRPALHPSVLVGLLHPTVPAISRLAGTGTRPFRWLPAGTFHRDNRPTSVLLELFLNSAVLENS